VATTTNAQQDSGFTPDAIQHLLLLGYGSNCFFEDNGLHANGHNTDHWSREVVKRTL
jgi:hypothetical protein